MTARRRGGVSGCRARGWDPRISEAAQLEEGLLEDLQAARSGCGGDYRGEEQAAAGDDNEAHAAGGACGRCGAVVTDQARTCNGAGPRADGESVVQGVCPVG